MVRIRVEFLYEGLRLVIFPSHPELALGHHRLKIDQVKMVGPSGKRSMISGTYPFYNLIKSHPICDELLLLQSEKATGWVSDYDIILISCFVL